MRISCARRCGSADGPRRRQLGGIRCHYGVTGGGFCGTFGVLAACRSKPISPRLGEKGADWVRGLQAFSWKRSLKMLLWTSVPAPRDKGLDFVTLAAAFAAGQLGLGGHQLAAERIGQDRLRQLLDPRRRRRDPLFD